MQAYNHSLKKSSSCSWQSS